MINPKPRIAFVANTSWSIYNFRLGILRKLQSLGYHIIVIAPHDSYSTRLIEEGFSFYPVPLNNYSTNPIREVLAFLSFFRCYRETKPDFIFHYTIKPNIYGSIAAWILRIPSIAVVTGLGRSFSFKRPLIQKTINFLYTLAARWSREVWFLNASNRDAFLKRKMVPASKTKMLPGEGVNPQRFKPSDTHFKTEMPRPNVRFMYAGRLLWDKGIQELADAARIIRQRYPSVIFELLGFIDPNNDNSVSFNQVEEWQREGLFKFRGEVVDVYFQLSQIDCVVLPSYHEGLSRILLEAASMAKPIITTNVPGCQEVVEHGVNGFLCKVKSSKDLARKIEDFILLDREKRLKMGDAGRKRVRQFFDERYVFPFYLEALSRYLKVSIPYSKPSLSDVVG